MNISKELLGKILCCTNINYDFIVDNPRIAEYDKTTLVYTKAIDKQRGEDRYISIYELAYKCKEWAANIGFNISSTSGYRGDNTPYAYAISSDGEEFPFIEADTEVESVFKVCEWILNNKDKLNG